MWLCVGLGNIGTRYDDTPHNLGFEVVETLAKRLGAPWREERRFQCHAASHGEGDARVWFVKPTTFMNLSGESVGPFSRYYKIPPEQVVVVSDDIALPMGRLRVREEGSAGGHNGLASLIQHLGTDAFVRIRVGIEPTGVPMRDLRTFVLMKMSGAYREDAHFMVQTAADCLESVIREGPKKAATRFNGFDARKLGA